MGYYNFKKDLDVSHSSVHKVCDALVMKGATILDIGATKDYDIKFEMNDKEYLMEVKEDLMASKTGNVAVEYMSRGKESGILSSLSPLWSYVIEGEIYFTTKHKILGLISQNDYRKVKGGDNRTSELFLVPLKDFVNICKTEYSSIG